MIFHFPFRKENLNIQSILPFYSILIIYLWQSTIDVATMFYALYLGLPFWYALAYLEVKNWKISQPEKIIITK